ncbi:MAG TPA: thioredoxin, partial [Methanomicrobia archaeon]|nr:thioredoxin [Methanomicrobia archaeon]
MNRSKEIDDVLADNKYPFLFFSADWCGFCKQQKPILEELAQEYGDLIEFIWLTEEDA